MYGLHRTGPCEVIFTEISFVKTLWVHSQSEIGSSPGQLTVLFPVQIPSRLNSLHYIVSSSEDPGGNFNIGETLVSWLLERWVLLVTILWQVVIPWHIEWILPSSSHFFPFQFYFCFCLICVFCKLFRYINRMKLSTISGRELPEPSDLKEV